MVTNASNTPDYDPKDFQSALAMLKAGGVILYPTDTIWGIGCDATNPCAIRRIFEIKRREDSKSMLSLVADFEMLKDWVEDIPLQAIEAIKSSDSPLTVIYPNPKGIADELKAEDGSAGFRITSESFSHDLAKELGHPIVSTSANISGEKTAMFFEDISGEILSKVDYVVLSKRVNANSSQRPSSIIKISPNGEISKLR